MSNEISVCMLRAARTQFESEVEVFIQGRLNGFHAATGMRITSMFVNLDQALSGEVRVRKVNAEVIV